MRSSRLFAALALLIVVAAGCNRADEVSPTSTATIAPSPGDTATPDPERVVLEWTRTGGVAGFCDGMTVTANHQATLGTCEDPGANLVTIFLPVDWIDRLERWRDLVASFDRTWEDPPNQSDRMTITLRLQGRGTTAPSEEEQQQIALFAAELHAALRQLNPRVATP